MAKTILISNKTYDNLEEVGKNYCHDSGPVYTNDRFCKIVNETFDYQLKLKNKLIYWWFKFWYKTNDYKKNKEISSKKYSKGYIFEKIFLFICIIGLILTLVYGLAIPIITSATKSILLLQGKAQGVIYANNQLIGYVFTNSEAAGILYNISTNNPTSSAAIMNETQYQDFLNILVKLGINDPSSIVNNMKSEIIKIGSTSMIIDLTNPMKEIIYAYMYVRNDTLGSLNVKNLKWENLVLNNNQAGQVILIPEIWLAYFTKGTVITPIVFTLFFIIVIWAYNRRRKKITPKIDNFALQDYINFKINTLKKFKILLKRSIPMVQGIKQLNHQFIFMADSLGTTQLYYNIRLMNYIYSIFKEMNCIMLINVADDSIIEQFQKICMQDFYQNIKLIVMDTDKVNELKSKDRTGYLYSDKYLEPINQNISLNEIKDIQSYNLNLKIKYKEYLKEDYENKIEEQIQKINSKINRLIFKNRRTLTNKEKRSILEEVVNQYNIQKEVIEYNFKKTITSIIKE